MPLEVIDPRKAAVLRELPKAVFETQVRYLGFGRNAWNATWINKYMTDCVSFHTDELERRAERKRVSGSVFKIATVPMLVLSYPSGSFGIMPINDRPEEDYEQFLDTWSTSKDYTFWQELPSARENWLLVFVLAEGNVEACPFTPSLRKSRSSGSKYRLVWEERPAESYAAFCSFARKIVKAF
jgi:hypothetical protein